MTRTLVPFAAERPKTRLDPILGADERRDLARAMLTDVLAALLAAGAEPTVLATARLDPSALPRPAGGGATDGVTDDGVSADAFSRVDVRVDDRELSPAVNAALSDAAPGPDSPLAVVMADLALATPAALSRLFAAGGDVAIAPGRGGGTNALVVRHPEFRVDYHGVSYRDHRRRAEALSASVAVVDSFRLATDVDEPDDLAELLLHGEGAARDWLERAGVELAVEGGRVGVRRG